MTRLTTWVPRLVALLGRAPAKQGRAAYIPSLPRVSSSGRPGCPQRGRYHFERPGDSICLSHNNSTEGDRTMRALGMIVIAVATAVLLPAAARAQGTTELKIAYVDSEELVQQAPGYEEAKQAFDR